jgi:hypothetical protein
MAAEEHISNYNGHLLSNQTAIPTIPANSPVLLPVDLSYSLSFRVDPQMSSGNETLTFSSDQPMRCGRFPWSGTIDPLTSGRVVSNNTAWKFSAYGNKYCNGQPYQTWTPADGNTSKDMSWAAGYDFTPLWNAAWQ